jgi:hypothetical protein
MLKMCWKRCLIDKETFKHLKLKHLLFVFLMHKLLFEFELYLILSLRFSFNCLAHDRIMNEFDSFDFVRIWHFHINATLKL